MRTALYCLASLALGAIGTAQASPEKKLHPYLAEKIEAAGDQEMLPVYFVMADRLGYDHWFPRVYRLSIEERRRTVMRELQEHAARTQDNLLYYLRLEQRAGRAEGIFSNWLGNFVQVRATRSVVLTAAALEEVGEVWYDHVPPLDQVEDGAAGTIEPAPEPVPELGPPPPPSMMVPGNGPLAVRADRVWALGFDGQGVVVMNADSGVDTSPGFHTDLDGRKWVNPGEIPGNGIDDDNNGFVDDLYGWNFRDNDNNLNDGGGHGTNTAGVMVADGTCNGTIYGVAPGARFMTGKLGGETSQWNAVQYAIQMGAHTQTSSHSYKLYFNPPPNYAMHRDIGEASLAAGLIRTNSTSNDGSRCNSTTSAARRPTNISAPGNLPPPYRDPNQTLVGRLGGVIGVAAWDWQNDSLKSYSPCGPFAWLLSDVRVNRSSYPSSSWDSVNDNDYPWRGGSQQGLLKPDIASPTDTRTTSSSPCSFRTFSGTSNATPNANGCMILWKSANMSLTPEDVAMIAHQTARDRGSQPGKENDWGAGVIDAEAGLYLALCVNRVDGQSAWEVDHSVAAGNLDVAVDSVPNTFAATVFGFSRTSVPFGPVTLGVGTPVFTFWAGLTDANGDGGASIPLGSNAIGLTIYTQSFAFDVNGPTGRILESNVVGVNIQS